MKKVILLAIVLVALCGMGQAQVTSSGSMSVTATVDPSISLTIVSDASGVALTGSGSASATLAFGNVRAYGYTPAAGVGFSRSGTSNFTISSPFAIHVEKANSTSTDYTLTAQLGSADATNTWKIGSDTLSAASATTLTSTGSYAADSAYTVSVVVPLTNTSGSVSKTINFAATAN